MWIKFPGINIKITPAFAVFFAFGANIFKNYTFLYSFLFALFHEAVHIVSLRVCGCHETVLEFLPGGIKMYSSGLGSLSHKKTIICTLSAPVANILTGALFYCAFLVWNKTAFNECAVINFMLGGVNLLPMSFLDGGRALSASLSLHFDCFSVRRISTAVSVVAIVFLCSVFFVLFCMKKYYLFLMFFCVYCVLGCICDKS